MRLALWAGAWAIGSLVAGRGVRGEDDRFLRVADEARAGVVRVQWRGPGLDAAVEERNAIVVDPDGLLLMAGPAPDPRGTLTATIPSEAARHQRERTTLARVVAGDPETALTLLWIPVGDLHALPILSALPVNRPLVQGEPGIPSPPPDPLPPGTAIVMVTGTTAVARGAIRAHHRHRVFPRPDAPPGDTNGIEVSGLEEAAMAAVAEDLGSPWLDAEGRVVGLLVGAVATLPDEPAAPGVNLRPEPIVAHAVSAPLIQVVWPLLRKDRAVHRAMLGVINEAASEAVESHVCKGCGGGHVIGTVLADGPADRAGVLSKDVLLGIDGRLLQRGVTLSEALLPHRPGDAVVLDLIRKGKPVRLEVVLGARPSD